MFKTHKPLGTTFDLSTTEAAAILHVSPQTLRDWTAARKIEAKFTRGGHRLYCERDVYELLRAEQGHPRDHYVMDVSVTLNGDGASQVRLGSPRLSSGAGAIPRKLYDDLLRTGQVARYVSTDDPVTVPGTPYEDRAVCVYVWAVAWEAKDALRVCEEGAVEAEAWLRANVKPVMGVVGWTLADGTTIDHSW